MLKIADNSAFNPSTSVHGHIPVKLQMWLHVFCVIPERPQTGHFAGPFNFLGNSYTISDNFEPSFIGTYNSAK